MSTATDASPGVGALLQAPIGRSRWARWHRGQLQRRRGADAAVSRVRACKAGVVVGASCLHVLAQPLW